MKRKFFTPVRTLLVGAALPLLGAVALTSAPQSAKAQPIDPARILYHIDFATVPTPETWLASEGDHFGGSGATDKLLDMDGVIIGVGSKTARVRSARAATNNNSNNLVPAPSNGYLMIVTRTTGIVQTSAPYVTLPTVKDTVDEIVAYIRAGSSGTYRAAFELLDPVNDTIVENSGLLSPSTNGSNTVRVSYKPQSFYDSYDSVKVRVKMICDESGKNGYISDIWLLSAPLPPTGISISSSEPRIALGGSCELTAKVEAYPYADQTTTWSLQSAADSAKATIASSGTATATLTGTAVGTVTVVGTTVNGLSTTATVEVAEIPDATAISITPEDETNELAVGGSYKLATATEPELAIQTATWEVLDAGILSLKVDAINAATVTGLAEGTARVVAKATTPGITDTVTLTVKVINLDSIAIAGSRVVYINGSGQLSAQTFPAKAGNHRVTWSSSNADIATIATINDSTGLITAGATVGSVTITATAADGGGATATREVRVANAYIDSLNAPNATVGKKLWTNNSSVGFSITQKDPQIDYDSLLYLSCSGQSGNRRAMLTFDDPISIETKTAIEFDWRPGPHHGGSGGEAQVTFRSGEKDIDDDIFTIYLKRTAKSGIYFAVGPIASTDFVASIEKNSIDYETRRVETGNGVPAEYRGGFSEAPLTTSSTAAAGVVGDWWYHTKINLYANDRVTVSTYNNSHPDSSTYFNDSITIPAPAGWNPKSINNIFFNMIRAGSNQGFISSFDNFSIRKADADAVVLPASVSITSQYEEIGTGAATVLTAKVGPFDVNDPSVVWSLSSAADSAIATIVANEPASLRQATLSTTGEGTVTVVATAINGISGAKSIFIGEILLDSIAISGDTIVAVNDAIELSKATFPSNAGNDSVTWSSNNPAVAEVDPVTGVVTGKSVGEVIITATAKDAGHKTATHNVKVEFASISRIDLQGARRIFYTANPAEEPAFTVTPVFSPTNASNKTLTWSSANSDVATVNNGVVTLKGYGNTAIKAVSNDGSGVEGYYYIEVYEPDQNPYDGFKDFEDGAYAPFGTPASTVAGIVGTLADFQQTKTVYFNVTSSSGNRFTVIPFKDALEGHIIRLRFDWFAGAPTATNASNAVLSIKADSSQESGMKHDATFTVTDNILTIRTDNEAKIFTYFTGDYTSDAASFLDVENDTLENISTFNRWYTVDLTINYILKTLSFTITERDNPAATQTVENVPLAEGLTPNRVKSIFMLVYRATGSLTYSTALDNLGYKTITYNLQPVTFDPNSGVFDGGSTESKIVEVISGEVFEDQVPGVSKENYDLVGWYLPDGTTPYTPKYTTDAPVTLTAKWQIWQYKVTFDAAEGTAVPEQTIDHGGRVTEPEEPTRAGYLFVGWYNGDNAWIFTNTVTSDLTLTAHWEKDEDDDGDGDGDGDGQTGVDDNVLSGIALYPNPAGSYVTLSGLKGGEAVDVINLSGTLLLSLKASGDKALIDLTSLSQGAYIVRVTNGSATKNLKLVVK
ncbi:MAG: Ig-like domain-containing protein [Prevotellaceae bacterium]|jgi:uncharacterized repeat protein (TIGR02543 family)|nr:Ig-like domain-containing protein [Prevotellaceae bacterium]